MLKEHSLLCFDIYLYTRYLRGRNHWSALVDSMLYMVVRMWYARPEETVLKRYFMHALFLCL